MKNTALLVASLIFLLVTIMHVLRFHMGIAIMIGSYSIPLQWSLYAGLFSLILCIWMFLATKFK